ncbi:MAG: putative manganese transporter [Desulfobia sp.]
MTEMLSESISHALMITGFVLMMMIVVEYFNILTGGLWQQAFRGSLWKQYLMAGLLGVIPGCLGVFVVVTLYSHRIVGFGALVTAMIATSGDEAFVMFTMIPAQAFFISCILFVVGMVTGILIDKLLIRKTGRDQGCHRELEYHEIEECHCFYWAQIKRQWERCSLARGVLTTALTLFSYGLLAGKLGPETWNWVKITILIVSAGALFIVVTVPEHFLEEHLWEHVVQVHAPRIFGWTLGALFLMHILLDHFQLTAWMQNNQLIMLLVASAVGIVPESGPHLIFLTLFAEKAIPFSTLLASSIIQDGHGMLPLLAESRLDFIKVKTINLAVGILLGFIGYLSGW